MLVICMHRKDILIIFHEGKYSDTRDVSRKLFKLSLYTYLHFVIFNIYICNFVQSTKFRLDINGVIIVPIPSVK